MNVSITPSHLRMTYVPVVEYIVAAGVMLLAGVGAFGSGEHSFGPAAEPFVRGSLAVLMVIGAILLLRAERMDHHVDRGRATIGLNWRSVLTSRSLTVPLRDVTAVLVEEDADASYGRPSRIVLVLRDASHVRLSDGYSPFRTPVIRASRQLSAFVGVPARDATD